MKTRERIIFGGASALAAGALAACATTSGQSGGPETSAKAPAASAATPNSIASTAFRGTVWGLQPNQVPFPGKVAFRDIPRDQAPLCSPYGPDNPMPLIQKSIGGKLMTLGVIDARDDRPQHCNPEIDSGTAGIAPTLGNVGPAIHDTTVNINGSPYIPDETVVEVLAYTIDGQKACNARHGASELWIEVSRFADGSSPEWVPNPNMDDWFTAAQLDRAKVPETIFTGPRPAAEGGCDAFSVFQ